MRISIFSDSVAALIALDSVLVSSKLVSECRNSLNNLGSWNKITLYWVLAYVGIPGNEKTDSQATRTETPHRWGNAKNIRNIDSVRNRQEPPNI